MSVKKLLLTSMLLISCAAATFAQRAQASVTPACRGTASANTASSSTSDDNDELKTQQEIIAELKMLRGANAALVGERDALKGQVQVLTRMAEVERERGDFFKVAAEKGTQIDSNSQRIGALDQQSIQILQAQIRDDEREVSGLRRDLDRCRTEKKWWALGGALGGAWVTSRIVQ